MMVVGMRRRRRWRWWVVVGVRRRGVSVLSKPEGFRLAVPSLFLWMVELGVGSIVVVVGFPVMVTMAADEISLELLGRRLSAESRAKTATLENRQLQLTLHELGSAIPRAGGRGGHESGGLGCISALTTLIRAHQVLQTQQNLLK